MKFKYLGTAAAEGIPAIFCECDVCMEARRRGERNIRTRSQAVIDDALLIDFPADSYMHSLNSSFNMAEIHTCLITHSHPDHLYAPDFEMRGHVFAHRKKPITLNVYSRSSSYNMIKAVTDTHKITEDEVSVHEVVSFEPFVSNGYRITALTASHAKATDPVVYIIEKDGKSLLYAHDTSDFPEETWAYLENCNIKFNFVSLDCTEGNNSIKYVGHMNIERCKDMKSKLIGLGLADNNTVFALNHFSHNGSMILYEEMCEFVKNDFVVAYDGMEIEI